MTSRTAWTAGNGQGLTYGTLINSADLASMASGSTVLSTVADIANGTNIDMFMDISVRLAIASSTIVAGANLVLYRFNLLDDGTTYGDGNFVAGTQKAATPVVPIIGTINLIAAASQTLLVGAIEQIVIPPGSFRYALQQNSGFALTAGTQTVKYRTYNLNLNN